MADLEIPPNVVMKREDDYNLSFIISPDSGHWKGGQFEFKFTFPAKYPFAGPKVSTPDTAHALSCIHEWSATPACRRSRKCLQRAPQLAAD